MLLTVSYSIDDNFNNRRTLGTYLLLLVLFLGVKLILQFNTFSPSCGHDHSHEDSGQSGPSQASLSHASLSAEGHSHEGHEHEGPEHGGSHRGHEHEGHEHGGSHGGHDHHHEHSTYTQQETDILAKIDRIDHLIKVPFIAMKAIYARVLYLPIGLLLLNSLWFLFLGLIPTVVLLFSFYITGLFDYFLSMEFFNQTSISILFMFTCQLILNLFNFFLLSNILRTKAMPILLISMFWTSLAAIPGAYIPTYLENLPGLSKVAMNLLGRFLRDLLITIGLTVIIFVSKSNPSRSSSSQITWPSLAIIFFHVTSCMTHIVERPTLERYATASERNNYELANNFLQTGFLGTLDFINYVTIQNENEDRELGENRERSLRRWFLAGKAIAIIGLLYVTLHGLVFQNPLTVVLFLKLICLYFTHAGFFSSLWNSLNVALALIIFPFRNILFMYALVNWVNSLSSFYVVLLMTEGTLIVSNFISYAYQLYNPRRIQ